MSVPDLLDTGTITAPAEKKQMSSVSASYDALVAQATKGEVSADVMQKVAALVDNLSNRNFPVATQIQAVSTPLPYLCSEFGLFARLHQSCIRTSRTPCGISTRTGSRALKF
jgi:hypothetical protein